MWPICCKGLFKLPIISLHEIDSDKVMVIHHDRVELQNHRKIYIEQLALHVFSQLTTFRAKEVNAIIWKVWKCSLYFMLEKSYGLFNPFFRSVFVPMTLCFSFHPRRCHFTHDVLDTLIIISNNNLLFIWDRKVRCAKSFPFIT